MSLLIHVLVYVFVVGLMWFFTNLEAAALMGNVLLLFFIVLQNIKDFKN